MNIYPISNNIRILVILAVSIAIMFLNSHAQAISSNWLTQELSIQTAGVSDFYSGFNSTCRTEQITMYGHFHAACVTTGSNLTFSTLPESSSANAISMGKDRNMYILTVMYGQSTNYLIQLLPDTDTAIVAKRDTQTVDIIANFSKHIVRKHENGFTSYVFDNSAVPMYTQSFQHVVYGQLFFSRNARFMATINQEEPNSVNYDFHLIDLFSGKDRTIGSPPNQPLYNQELYKGVAVSNDGKYIAASVPVPNLDTIDASDDYHIGIKIWNTQNCREGSEENSHLSSDICESKTINSEFDDVNLTTRPGKVLGLNFSDENDQLSIFSVHGDQEYQTIIEQTSRHIANVDYLALGDSFSSGEGDSGNSGSHYLKNTNSVVKKNGVPINNYCHVSDRSYPYLLKSQFKDFRAEVHNVACSGALVRNDYTGSNRGYKGQDGRLNVNLPSSTIDEIKQSSIDNFTPGYNKQIEFVKKYKPKMVTLTGGGNDVDFSKIIESCAYIGTCDYVSDDVKRKQLGRAIQLQFKPLVELYRSIHRVSPLTKIYALGYPQFFSDTNTVCMPNVLLNKSERELARQGVSYLNMVISNAAKTAGVTFIDIENSMQGHVLCGQSPSYITGLSRQDRIGNAPWSQGSYHPNSYGHIAMKNAFVASLDQESPLAFQHCSSGSTCPYDGPIDIRPPKYFGFTTSSKVDSSQADTFTSNQINKYNPVPINTNGLAPNSQVRISIASIPTRIGDYTSDNDGNLQISVRIPTNIAVGYHTLYLETQSYSGESLTLWQPVLVTGYENDLDNNNVSDSQQPCSFMDISLKDIDDNCKYTNAPQSHTDTLINDAPLVLKGVKASTRAPHMNHTLSDVLSQVKNVARTQINPLHSTKVDTSSENTKRKLVSTKKYTPNNQPESYYYRIKLIITILVLTTAIIILRKKK